MAACSLKGFYGKGQRCCFSFPGRAGHHGSQAQWRTWDLRHSPGAIALTSHRPECVMTPASMCTESSGAGKPESSVWGQSGLWRSLCSVLGVEGGGVRGLGLVPRPSLVGLNPKTPQRSRLPTVPKKLTSVSHCLNCQA